MMAVKKEKNTKNNTENSGNIADSGDEGDKLEYTDIQSQFLVLLKKYPVNLPETIVDYVTSQGENVLENPEKMAMALRECDISPVRRHQILKHWFADKGIVVPDSILNKVLSNTPLSGQENETDGGKRTKDKYSVDRETGDIIVANSEDIAISYDEAVKLSEKIKTEKKVKEKGVGPKYVYDPSVKAIRMAKDGEQGGTLEEAKELKAMADKDDKPMTESPFMLDENGKWQLVPGAKLSTIEMMAWQSIQKANATGEPVDPMMEMVSYAEKLKNLRDVFGGGVGLPAYLSSPEAFTAAVKAAVGGDNEAVKALNAKIDTMIAEQHAAELRRRDEDNAALQNQIASANNKIKDLEERLESKTTTTGKTAYDLLDNISKKIPDAKEMQGIVQQVVSNPPKFPGGAGADRSKTLASVADQMEASAALKNTEDTWFNMK